MMAALCMNSCSSLCILLGDWCGVCTLYICMYVCMYVYAYTYIHIYIYIYIIRMLMDINDVCTHVFLCILCICSIDAHVHMHIHTLKHTHTHRYQSIVVFTLYTKKTLSCSYTKIHVYTYRGVHQSQPTSGSYLHAWRQQDGHGRHDAPGYTQNYSQVRWLHDGKAVWRHFCWWAPQVCVCFWLYDGTAVCTYICMSSIVVCLFVCELYAHTLVWARAQ
jgi:hypothetical protein